MIRPSLVTLTMNCSSRNASSTVSWLSHLESAICSAMASRRAIGGTVTHTDRASKTMAVKTADGTEETFKRSGQAAADAGKDISRGAEKTTKVTVYYTEKPTRKPSISSKNSRLDYSVRGVVR